MGGKRTRRTQQKRLHDLDADELFAVIVDCPPSRSREAQVKYAAAVEYARVLPPEELAGLVHNSLKIGDEPTALGAAAVGYERGDSAAMVAYGTRRGDRLDAIQRWADLTHTPAGA